MATSSVEASQVVTPAGVVGPARVVIEDGLIASIDSISTAPERTLVPGFVDLQVNGIDDVDVATADGDDWDRLDALLAAQGTTTWCPTLVSAPLDSYRGPLARIGAAAARADGGRPQIAGAHLEGPFLGGAPGAHDPALIAPVDRAWLADLAPVVRLVTLAPEADGATAAIGDLADRGVLVSLGHSTATYEEATAAIDAGARLVTHLFNAMAPLHHRQPGLVGAALTDDRVAVALIADKVHVHPAALRLAFRAKGADGVVLVTDAVALRAGIRVVDGAPRLADGTLAGSVLTMDAAVRNAVAAGVDPADAVRAASTTPARLLGLTDRGAIASGMRADLVALLPGLEVGTVWIAGQEAAGPSG